MDFNIRGHLHRIDNAYWQPAEQFIRESFQEHRCLASTLAVFAVMSFVPVVSAVALASFICILAAAGCLLTIVALGLLLSVTLSVTLVFSAILTLMASGAIWSVGSLGRQGDAPATEPTPTITAVPNSHHIYLQRAYTGLKHVLQKAPGWKWSLLGFVLFRNLFGRILLGRAARQHRFYPYVFGSNRTAHPLKWVLIDALDMLLSIPSRLISSINVVVLTACLLLALASPRVRSFLGQKIRQLLGMAPVEQPAQDAPVTGEAPPPASLVYLQRAYAGLKCALRNAPGWKPTLLGFLLLRNLFARIFLPRVVRYHPFYPYVFGSDRTPHPLKWVLIDAIQPVHMLLSIVFFLPLRLLSAFDAEAILTACVLLTLMSPSTRSFAGKQIRELWEARQPVDAGAAAATASDAPESTAHASEPTQVQEMHSADIVGEGASTTAISTAEGSSGEGVRARQVQVVN
ncbi:hypothetical protein DFH09DRAFT_1371184 [Mycena vulgaris]|nr:hypothetical protein DFH09DRAFT_1371184 [Mycena vulgaris]